MIIIIPNNIKLTCKQFFNIISPMKKILIPSLLLSTALFADSQFYVGVLGGANYESFGSPYNTSTSSPVAKVQLGYGDIKDYSVQLGLLYDKNNHNIFSTGTTNDKEKYSMDVELIKAFDFGWKLYPFLKAGFGAGYFNINADYTGGNKSSLNFSSYNAGAGAYYSLSEHFNLEAGVTYKSVSYEKIDPNASAKGISTKVIFTYLGVNYRF